MSKTARICNVCGEVIAVNEEDAGKIVACPACGSVNVYSLENLYEARRQVELLQWLVDAGFQVYYLEKKWYITKYNETTKKYEIVSSGTNLFDQIDTLKLAITVRKEEK